MKRRVPQLAVLLGLLGPAVASAADWVQIYQNVNEGGKSLRVELPAPGTNYLSGHTYLVGSVRRTGPQIKAAVGGVLYHGASSFRVWAADSPVALYLWEGDNFDGRMVRVFVAKGASSVMNSPGWFNDRLGSFILVREKEVPSGLGQLTDTSIPLDDMATSIRTQISKKLASNSDIEDFWLHDTEVNYDTAQSVWTEWGEPTSYWQKYYDLVRIKQEIEIDPNWWPANYDTWMKLAYFFDTDSEKHLHFTWAAWAVWVESGTISNKIANGLAAAVSGDLVGTGNSIRDGIKSGIEDKIGALTPVVWDNVAKVGWKIPCNNFNNLSGYTAPAQPFCSAAGSRKEMFPPTLILHHNPKDP